MDTYTIRETKMTPTEGKKQKLYYFEELDVISVELTD
jgi:hypothetical protein